MDGHGTHVSSTAAEDTNNSLAGAGIAYKATIMPLKACMGYWDVQFTLSAQGYRGFVNPAQAKPGDLVLFGNSHIAMVQSVQGGTIHYIGGNQSDNVTTGTTSTGAVDVVRPAYQ